MKQEKIQRARFQEFRRKREVGRMREKRGGCRNWPSPKDAPLRLPGSVADTLTTHWSYSANFVQRLPGARDFLTGREKKKEREEGENGKGGTKKKPPRLDSGVYRHVQSTRFSFLSRWKLWSQAETKKKVRGGKGEPKGEGEH